MSGWGNIGRPFVVVIIAALMSMTAISSLIIYTSEQTTKVQVELAASQILRQELTEEATAAADEIGDNFENLERILQAVSRALVSLGPDHNVTQGVLDRTSFAVGAYTDTLIWLDADGRLLQSTGGAAWPEGSDLSDQQFYQVPLATNQVSVSLPFTDATGTAYFAIAVPMPRSETDGSFNGILAALVRVDSIDMSFLKESRFMNARIVVVANDGTMLVHPSESLEGKNTASPAAVDILTEENRDLAKRNFQLMLQSRSGIFEYHEEGRELEMLAYEPVIVNGVYTWTAGIIEPVSAIREPFVRVIEEQQNFTLIALVLMGTISAIFIAFILVINRRLFATVGKQNAEIKSNMSELQAAYDRLKEQDVIKDEFINIAAHELRTPVLPIILSAENLADNMPEDENLKIILRNANRITKLTNDILDVSRVESNTFKLQKQKTDIQQLVDEVVQDGRLKVPRDQSVEITSESRLPPSMNEVSIDRGRISQVLTNIVENAIHFTEQGAVRVLLEPAENRQIRISVVDSGKGIDPAIKDKLFGKFVSKSDRAKGTGLGLYLSKAIVEAHGGTITGENSKTGKGATFSFTLPA
jgi:signal transduction histidine kinase